jgi:hypothetical protein
MDIMCVYVLVSASCVVRKSLLNFLEFISSLLEIAGGCLARPPKKNRSFALPSGCTIIYTDIY